VAKVLVSDKLDPQGLEILEQASGLTVVYEPGLKGDELLAAVADVDGLVIRSGTQVTAEVIAAAEKLRAIGRAGIGVDNIDVSAATARGIVVMNTPSGNNITTAEHAIALLISLARHIPQATASMKAGKWEKSRFTGMELYNRTFAVIGLGNIGRIVAQRAKGLGMKVIAYDPFLSGSAKARAEVELVSLDEMLTRADAISVHVPRTPETTGLLNDEAFGKMRPGVLIINAARGGIVDEAALLRALDSGRVGGAAVDVFTKEPPSQVNVAIAVAEQVRDYLVDGIVGNALNVPSISKELYEQIRPYSELGEKLGRFQGQLCPGAIDRVEIEYSGDAAGLEVAPITVSILKGILESVSDEVNLVNAPLIAKEHGIEVVESKVSRSRDFASAISTRVVGCENRYIVGAVFHGDQPRIVRIDDFMLEAIPKGSTLFIQNQDQPGVVGSVGTVLGQGGINISRMQLALIPERSLAAMLVNIDRAPEEAVMKQLRSLPHLISAQLVELGS